MPLSCPRCRCIAENLSSHPAPAMMYGFSLLLCMSSALSEPGGRGLGTLGFTIDVAHDMFVKAGFSRIEVIDVPHDTKTRYWIVSE